MLLIPINRISLLPLKIGVCIEKASSGRAGVRTTTSSGFTGWVFIQSSVVIQCQTVWIDIPAAPFTGCMQASYLISFLSLLIC